MNINFKSFHKNTFILCNSNSDICYQVDEKCVNILLSHYFQFIIATPYDTIIVQTKTKLDYNKRNSLSGFLDKIIY